jgi:hypothetical protein
MREYQVTLNVDGHQVRIRVIANDAASARRFALAQYYGHEVHVIRTTRIRE